MKKQKTFKFGAFFERYALTPPSFSAARRRKKRSKIQLFFNAPNKFGQLKILTVWAFVLLATAPPANAAIRVGAAREAITPQRPAWLAGYSRNRLSESTHDDLYAHCLYLQDDDKAALIVSLDLIGYMYRDVVETRAVLEKEGFDGGRVFIAATHTHSGPDTIGLWGSDGVTSGRDDAYMEFARERILSCAKKARGSAERVIVGVGAVAISGVCENRRDPGVQDNEARLLQFRTARGAVPATVVNYGCHPEAMDSSAISSDFVSIYYDRVRAATGGEAMFLNGALGGMVVPAIAEYSWEEAERVGALFADQVEEGLSRLDWSREESFEFFSEPFSLPFESPKLREVGAALGLPDGVSDVVLPTEITYVRIGEAEMISAPGEPLPKVGFRLKEKLTGKHRFLLSLGNDELGYLIPREDFTPGRYEESVSPGIRTEEILLEAAGRLLEGVREHARAPRE